MVLFNKSPHKGFEATVFSYDKHYDGHSGRQIFALIRGISLIFLYLYSLGCCV